MSEKYNVTSSLHESATDVITLEKRILENLHPDLWTAISYAFDRERYIKEAAAAAQADASTALSLLGSASGSVIVTDDGGLAMSMKNYTGGVSVKGQVVVADRTIVEAGDAANQISAWTFAGESMANTDAGQLYYELTVPDTITYYWGGVTDAPVVYHYEGVIDSPTVYYWEGITDAPVVLYWELTVDDPVLLYWQTSVPGGNATVSVYSDAGLTTKVAEGALAGDGGGAIVLAEVAGSGITGGVTVTAGLQADTGWLSIWDDVITEHGDGGAQCSGWSIVGEAQTMTTVSVYSDAAKTVLEMHGHVDHDTGGAIVLAATGAISGTVTVVADAVADTDAGNTLSCLDDVVTEAGDAAAQCSGWTVVGEAQTMYTVNVYSDAGKTTLVSTGTVDHSAGGVGVALAAFGGSGISWTVDVIASAVDDTDGANTLSVLDGAATEAGDAANQFDNWTPAGTPATMYTVTVYDGIAHTTKLCEGTVDHVAGGAGVVLAEFGGSGISGTVDVAAGAADSVADANTLSILDDVVTEAGDAGGAFANWTIVGEPQTQYTVTVYADSAGTIPLCQGSVDHDTGGAGVVLASIHPSLVAGTVDVIPNATDDAVAVANTLTITAGVVVEAGDAGGCLDNWTITEEAQSLITCYSDSAKTVPVCAGSVDNTTGGAVTLAATGGSGLTGTCTVIPLAVTDTDAGNILTFGTDKAAELCAINGTGAIGVVYTAGVAQGGSMWVTFAGDAYVLREPASAIAKGAWVRTGSTTAGYCECEWDYDAGQSQQQIGYAAERVEATGATTVRVHLCRR